MAVRLFVGNLSYSTTEADLRDLLRHRRAAVAGRAAGRSGDRPAARLRVRRVPGSRARRAGDSAVQRAGVQRPAAGRQRSARARRSRTRRSAAARRILGPTPGRRRLRPASAGRSADRRVRSIRARPARPAQPQLRARRQAATRRSAKAKKKEAERPRGPIPLKVTGRSFTLDDDSPDEPLPDIDDFATSKPTEKEDEDKEKDEDTDETSEQRRIEWIVPPDLNPWERLLAQVRTEVDAEDFRRWFASTSYAGDSAIRSRSGSDRRRTAATSRPTTRTSSSARSKRSSVPTPTSASSSPASTTMTTKIATICESSVARAPPPPCHATIVGDELVPQPLLAHRDRLHALPGGDARRAGGAVRLGRLAIRADDAGPAAGALRADRRRRDLRRARARARPRPRSSSSARSTAATRTRSGDAGRRPHGWERHVPRFLRRAGPQDARAAAAAGLRTVRPRKTLRSRRSRRPRAGSRSGARPDAGMRPPPGRAEASAQGAAPASGRCARRSFVVNDQVAGVVVVPPRAPFSFLLSRYAPTLALITGVVLIAGALLAAVVIFGPARRRLRGVEDAARRLGGGDLVGPRTRPRRRRSRGRGQRRSTRWPTTSRPAPRRWRRRTARGVSCWPTSRTS